MTRAICAEYCCPAQEHDGVVAARLLRGLRYRVVTIDKGYLSRKLQAEAARYGVDLIAKPRRNMRSFSQREKRLRQGQRIIESVFSSLDRLGLSEHPYRKTQGLIFHIYTVLIAYGLHKRMSATPLGGSWAPMGMGWRRGCFSELGYSTKFSSHPRS